jgi:hypothetical protein
MDGKTEVSFGIIKSIFLNSQSYQYDASEKTFIGLD